jgi:hypothetical protein
VIGVDLDLYDDPSKDHPAAERQAAWRELVALLGSLPESPRATSRDDDGASGIRLYRVPAGRKGAGILPAFRSAMATRSRMGARPGPAS